MSANGGWRLTDIIFATAVVCWILTGSVGYVPVDTDAIDSVVIVSAVAIDDSFDDV